MEKETIMLILKIIGFLGIPAIGLIIWLIQQLITAKAGVLSTKKECSRLEDKLSNSEKRITELEEILSEHTQEDKLLSKYEHDTKLGILKRKDDGVAFCKPCLYKNKREVQLVNRGYYWHCNVCDWDSPNFANPDLPSVSAPDDGYG